MTTMDNIYHLLKEAAQLNPENEFVVSDQGERYTYKLFLDLVHRIKTDWLSHGVTSKSLILLAESSPLRTLELLFAAWAMECSVMLAAPAAFPFIKASLLTTANPNVIAENGQLSFDTSHDQPLPNQETNRTLQIIVFTSGTAASPKGVIHSHSSILANAKAIMRYITLNPEDRVLVVKSLYHIAAISAQIIPVLLSGSTLFLPSSGKPPQYLANYIHNENITYIDTVATLWRYITLAFQSTGAYPHSLRLLSINGEHVSPAELARFQQNLPKAALFYAYGQTEAGPRITYLPHAYIETKGCSVGIPLDGVRLRIQKPEESFTLFAEDEACNPLIGEILVQSPSLMEGYWNRPELNLEKLKEGWLLTGDIGYLDDDGFLYLLGRSNDRIVRGGQTIYTHEIENAIMSVAWVKECFIHGEPDVMNGQKIIAYISPTNLVQASRADMYQQLRILLPGYLIPQEIIFCDNLPKSANGKLKKERN